MQRAIRSVALALALLVLAAGAAQARPLAVRPSPTGVLDALWQWATAQFPAWVKEGGTMDPDGYNNKEGGTMDPNGSPHTLLAPHSGSDAGGMMDPNG